MRNKSSHSGYHSPRARYNRNRKAMTDQERDKHDSEVNFTMWILVIVGLLIAVGIVASGGTIK